MAYCKVLIIGAGASGIAAASRLAEKGLTEFLILEAENRIGGRIFSTPFDKNNIIDLGAQWVHGEKNNVAYELAKPLNLLDNPTFEIFNGHFVDSSGKDFDQNKVQNILSTLYDISKQLDKLTISSGSLGDFFAKEFHKRKLTDENLTTQEANLIYEWYERFENSIEGSNSWFKTSASGLAQYWDCEGELLNIWKQGGYHNILDILMQRVPNPQIFKEKILLNKEVSKISWRDTFSSNLLRKGVTPGRVLVRCFDGSQFEADHVIITTSIGVLKERAYTLFHPTLPSSKLIAIKGISFDTVDKIFLRFSEPWWPVDSHGFSLVWSEEDRNNFSPPAECPQNLGGPHWLTEVFGFYTVENCPNILCGWVVGTAAHQMEQISSSEVLEGCYYLLKRFLAKQFKITRPVEILRSSWGLNSHFKGSYSFRSIDTDILATSASILGEPLEDPQGKPLVLFAGEATHPHYYSTVHGAIEAGWREADRLIPYLSAKQISPIEYDIIIIGAGISGLSAARNFVNHGFQNFIILEAEKEPGGRIHSQSFGGGWVEAGAQWIHGEENTLCRLAKDLDLLDDFSSSEGEGPYLCPDGTSVDLALVNEVAGIIGQILEDCESFAFDGQIKSPNSLGDYLSERFENYISSSNDSDLIKKRKRQLYNWHLRFQIIDNSCNNLEELSAKAWGKYSFCGGEDYLNFKNGFSSLVQSIVQQLPKDSLVLNTPVVKIKYNTRINLKNDQSSYPIEVITAQGEFYKAKHIIMTPSIGFLKENHEKIFKPALPRSHLKIIQSVGFSTINKIFLEFDNRWWTNDLKGIQLLWDYPDTETYYWTHDLSGFDVLPNHKAVLLGWIGGRGATHVERLTESDIGKECVQLLRKFLNNPDIPNPRNVTRSQWSSNPYFLGAYSHITTACDKLQTYPEQLLEPVHIPIEDSESAIQQWPAILFAGEALHPKHYSTTHGAFEVGYWQSEKLIHFITKQKLDNLSTT